VKKNILANFRARHFKSTPHPTKKRWFYGDGSGQLAQTVAIEAAPATTTTTTTTKTNKQTNKHTNTLTH